MKRDISVYCLLFRLLKLCCLANMMFLYQFREGFIRYMRVPYDHVYNSSIVQLSYVRHNRSKTLYKRKFSCVVFLWACLICLIRKFQRRVTSAAAALVQYDVVELTGNELICVEFHDGRRMITDQSLSFNDVKRIDFKSVYVCAEFIVEESNSSISHYDVSTFMNTFYASFVNTLRKKPLTINDIARIAFALKYVNTEFWMKKIRLIVTDLMTIEDKVYVDQQLFLN